MKAQALFLLLCVFSSPSSKGAPTDKGKQIQALLIHEAACSNEQAYAYFIDFEKFGKLHPVIKETKNIVPPSGNSMGIFSVKEFIFLFGFIPMHPKYNAEVIEVEKGVKIKYLSQVKKNVHLEILFSFSENEQHSTVIHEEITISGNHMICSMLLREMKKKHLLLIENLKKEVQKKAN